MICHKTKPHTHTHTHIYVYMIHFVFYYTSCKQLAADLEIDKCDICSVGDNHFTHSSCPSLSGDINKQKCFKSLLWKSPCSGRRQSCCTRAKTFTIAVVQFTDCRKQSSGWGSVKRRKWLNIYCKSSWSFLVKRERERNVKFKVKADVWSWCHSKRRASDTNAHTRWYILFSWLLFLLGSVGLVSLFSGISTFVGLFNVKEIIVEEQSLYYLTNS